MLSKIAVAIQERADDPLVSVVIPTYQREKVLLDTVDYLLRLDIRPAEILLVDQTREHEEATGQALESLDLQGKIRWIRLAQPSITNAMNTGLMQARSEIVLFLDDDIIPHANLIAAHARAHAEGLCNIVAGQVLQPGEEVLAEPPAMGEFLFRSGQRAWVHELMGGNFSVKKAAALKLGGFDENFVRVAYRFEAEFCDRATTAGEKILFEPAASIRHLRVGSGGTRSFGEHLTTIKPHHAVGAYYFLLRARHVRWRWWQMVLRPLRAVRTRHHLRHPWWIPLTLAAEFGGFVWALGLRVRKQKLIDGQRPAGAGG